KATGKPIAQARVFYYPLYANPYVNKKIDGIWWPRSEATTGPDGSYILTVLPGQGVLGVATYKPDVYMPAVEPTPKEIKDFCKVPLAIDHLSWAIGGSRGAIIHDLSKHPDAIVLLEPDEKDKALVKNVALEPARYLTVKGRVVGADGKPL